MVQAALKATFGEGLVRLIVISIRFADMEASQENRTQRQRR